MFVNPQHIPNDMESNDDDEDEHLEGDDGCRAPKFLVDPLEGPSMRQCGRSWNLEHDPDFQH
jgi:hypothetical protein